jgi:predicted lipid-binding transport protein (Tim44 family)
MEALKILTSIFGSKNQNQQMSEKHEHFSAVAASAPEPMGAVMGKLGVVWAGFFAGMSLGDWVLVATLVYTLLQIALAIVERIIKPILASRKEAKKSSQLSQEN